MHHWESKYTHIFKDSGHHDEKIRDLEKEINDLKDQVAHWELKYMGSHKEINELKDEVHLWKEKSEMHRTKYEKITIEINSHTSSSHHYE
jgi:archaellum component FlaC